VPPRFGPCTGVPAAGATSADPTTTAANTIHGRLMIDPSTLLTARRYVIFRT
jgi:hypothetical protein